MKKIVCFRGRDIIDHNTDMSKVRSRGRWRAGMMGSMSSMMQPAKKLIAAVTFAAGLFMSLASVSYSADCAVNFDDPTAISNIFQKASSTFVVPSTRSNGQITQWTVPEANPTSAQRDMNRWEYRQNCGSLGISVWEQTYHNHFHLMFKDPTLQCVTEIGFGRMIGGKCVPPADYSREPRVAVSMGADAWWEILLLNPYSGTLRTFDLKTIAVGGTTPIQMWFRKKDGSVWGFSQLSAGVNWDVSGSASGIVAVWVSGGLGARGPFTINGFTIRAY